MRTLTVRLPAALVTEIDEESRVRSMTRSDVVRERLLARDRKASVGSNLLAGIEDLIGSVGDLPRELSSRTKESLAAAGYGTKPRR